MQNREWRRPRTSTNDGKRARDRDGTWSREQHTRVCVTSEAARLGRREGAYLGCALNYELDSKDSQAEGSKNCSREKSACGKVVDVPSADQALRHALNRVSRAGYHSRALLGSAQQAPGKHPPWREARGSTPDAGVVRPVLEHSQRRVQQILRLEKISFQTPSPVLTHQGWHTNVPTVSLIAARGCVFWCARR